MKRAPYLADAKPLQPGDDLPEHYLTADSLEEYHELGRTFREAARRRDPRAADIVDTKIAHEGQHGYAITELGGIAVYTMVVFKPEGFIQKRHPFHLKTRVDGLEHGSPEYTVTTAYPEDLSAGDKAYLDNRGLTVADVDAIAVEHGWHNIRPLSLHHE